MSDLPSARVTLSVTESSGSIDPLHSARGVFTICPTPFDESLAVDLASIDTLVEFQIAAGVTGLAILGFLGEAHKLSNTERAAVIERFAGELPGTRWLLLGPAAAQDSVCRHDAAGDAVDHGSLIEYWGPHSGGFPALAVLQMPVRSERPLGTVEGEPNSGDYRLVADPALFEAQLSALEEMRARELIHVGDDIRVWQEDESPYERIVQGLKDRGAMPGRIAMSISCTCGCPEMTWAWRTSTCRTTWSASSAIRWTW